MSLPLSPKICIIGAGAIGGFLGAQLAQIFDNVSVIARGQTLRNLQKRGWILKTSGKQIISPVYAVSDSSTLGIQDYVILSVKSYSLEEIAVYLNNLVGPYTVVIPVINGIPWWFHSQINNPNQSKLIEGDLSFVLPHHQVLGAVAYPSCHCIEPGMVSHDGGNRLILGEPDTSTVTPITQRLLTFVSVLKAAGIDATVSSEIRTEVWKKILGNACFNPVSLLTNSSTDLLIDDPLIYSLFESMMNEIMLIGSSIGINLETKISDRIDATRKLGRIKTSMLQDAEAGRFVEIQAILGSLLSIGMQHEVPTPNLKTVYALSRMRAESMGLLKGKNGYHS